MISAVFSRKVGGGGGGRTPKAAKLLKTPAEDGSGVSFGVSVKRERKKKEGSKSMWCRADANNSAPTPAVAALLALLV